MLYRVHEHRKAGYWHRQETRVLSQGSEGYKGQRITAAQAGDWGAEEPYRQDAGKAGDTVKQVKNTHPHHVFTAHERGHELLLVGGGRNAYLWVGPRDGGIGGTIYTFVGQQTLRALARAILREVPARKLGGKREQVRR